MVSAEASLLDAKNQPFTYETLHEQYSISILWLCPGHVNGSIRCGLSVLDLDSIESRQTYEATSYAWGNVTEMETIICNGQSLSITRALFEALQVFRHSEGDGKRALRTDSICINQNDTGERNHQIQLMRRIYTAASKVLIWLGHGDPETIEASFNLVCQASERALSQEFKHSGGISGSIQEITELQYVWREHISAGQLSRRHDRLPSHHTRYKFYALFLTVVGSTVSWSSGSWCFLALQKYFGV